MRISFTFFNIFLIVLGIITAGSWFTQIACIFAKQPVDHFAYTLINVFFTIVWLWLAHWSRRYQNDIREYNKNN